MYSKFIHSDNALGNNCFIEYPPFILLSFLHPLKTKGSNTSKSFGKVTSFRLTHPSKV